MGTLSLLPCHEGLDLILQGPRAPCWSYSSTAPLPATPKSHQVSSPSKGQLQLCHPLASPKSGIGNPPSFKSHPPPQEVPQTYPGHLSPSQLLAWGVAHSWLYKHAWHGSCLLHQGGGGGVAGRAWGWHCSPSTHSATPVKWWTVVRVK